MGHVYLSLGRNETGQLMVGCPHVPVWAHVNMFRFPDGSATYQCRFFGSTFFFKPSHETIVVWCPQCWKKLGELERVITSAGLNNMD